MRYCTLMECDGHISEGPKKVLLMVDLISSPFFHPDDQILSNTKTYFRVSFYTLDLY